MALHVILWLASAIVGTIAIVVGTVIGPTNAPAPRWGGINLLALSVALLAWGFFAQAIGH